MTAVQWKRLVKKQLTALGNEEKAYDSVISTLADILEQRMPYISNTEMRAVNPSGNTPTKGAQPILPRTLF